MKEVREVENRLWGRMLVDHYRRKDDDDVHQ
jgi:hypothetical protein